MRHRSLALARGRAGYRLRSPAQGSRDTTPVNRSTGRCLCGGRADGGVALRFVRGVGTGGPRAGEPVRADDSRFQRSSRSRPPRSHAPAPPWGPARAPRAFASAWSPPPSGQGQASRVRKLPPRCFLDWLPAADHSFLLPFLEAVGSGLGRRDRAQEPPFRWLAGGPCLPRKTRQAMCGLGAHGPRPGAPQPAAASRQWVDGLPAEPRRGKLCLSRRRRELRSCEPPSTAWRQGSACLEASRGEFLQKGFASLRLREIKYFAPNLGCAGKIRKAKTRSIFWSVGDSVKA